MKRVLCLMITMCILFGTVNIEAVNVVWSESTLVSGEVIANVTGIEEGDRVAIATYDNGIFSDFNMVWSEGEEQSVNISVKDTDDMARAFVWNKTSMMPKMSGSVLTKDGIFDNTTIYSDNQQVNNSQAVGYKTIAPMKGDYSVSFDMIVKTKGDNAVILGDSSNGTIGYGEASAMLQFNGDNFTVRRGDGTGGYLETAVTLCAVETDKPYHITIRGNTEMNIFNVIINDGETEIVSDIMRARKNATAAGIDTIAFVNNSKNTSVTDGVYSNYNFSGTDFEFLNVSTLEIPQYTYTGFEGVYYGVEVVSEGKYVRGNNGKLTVDYSSVSDASAMFMPRDMGDGSHAFICKSSTNRMTTEGVSGEVLTSSAYASNNSTQHWVMEESENYTENNKTYYLRHIDGSNYIGLSGTNLALVSASEKKELRFVPVVGESLLYQVSQTEAYSLLSQAQKERFESVYGSVAADVFGRYGGMDDWTPGIRMDNLFTEILSETLTEAERLSKLESFLKRGDNSHIYSGQTNYETISLTLPGSVGCYTEIGEGEEGSYDFWRGTMLTGVKYPVTIYDAEGNAEQTLTVYVENNETAQHNYDIFLQAIIQIPYPFRKYLKTAKIRNDSANSFNGGGNDVYVRINWKMDRGGMRSTLVHELGHIVDQQCGNWSSGSGWSNAIQKDMYSPSTYGASNNTEDFAEFSRMYFAAYSNKDMQQALRIIMPERYASFGKLRQNNLSGWGLWEDEYTS